MRASLGFFFVLAIMACSPGGTTVDVDNDYWLRQISQANEVLQREDLTVEESGRAMIRIARARSALGQDSEAVKIWETLFADEGADPESRARSTYRLALWNEQHGRWSEAINFFQAYALLHTQLSAEQKSRFDENTENPASLLFHVGEIQEYKLGDAGGANDSYIAALSYAEETNNLNLIELKKLFGDYLFRRGRIEEALGEYKDVTNTDSFSDRPPSTVSTTARIRMIECLCLLDRCEEARLALQPLANRWAGTEYERRTGYVKKGEGLIREHCPE